MDSLPPNAADIVAAAQRVAVAVARAEKYGGAHQQAVADSVRALAQTVGLTDGWDSGAHPSDAQPTTNPPCPQSGPNGDACDFDAGHTAAHSWETVPLPEAALFAPPEMATSLVQASGHVPQEQVASVQTEVVTDGS